MPGRHRAGWPSQKYWLPLWAGLGAIIGAGIHYYRIPTTYEASTSILVVPPRLSVDGLEPIVEAGFDERLGGIAGRTFSPARLERIIESFNLYESDRDEMLREDLIERMDRDIAVRTDPAAHEHGTVLTVSFLYTDAPTAQKVTERLRYLLLDETSTERDVLTQAVLQFLESEADELKTRLETSQTHLKESTAERPERRPSQELVIENEVLAERYRTLLRNLEASTTAARLGGRQIRPLVKRIDTPVVVARPMSSTLAPYLIVGALYALIIRLLIGLGSYAFRKWRARRTSVPVLSAD